MKVRLTSEAIARIKHPKAYHTIKKGLMVPMGCTAYATVWHAVRANEWNGRLTTEAVLLYLEDKLNMKRDRFLEIVDDTL